MSTDRRIGIFVLVASVPLLIGGLWLIVAGPVLNGLLALGTGLACGAQGVCYVYRDGRWS